MVNILNNPIEEDITLLKKWIEENKEYFQLCWEKYLETYNQQTSKRSKKYYKDNLEKVKEYHKKWIEDNPDYDKKYYKDNLEKIKEWGKKWRKEHKEDIKKYYEEHKEYFQKYSKKYHKSQKVKDRINKQVKKRRKEDPVFRLICNLRIGVSKALKQYSKTGKIIKSKDLGIDYKKIIKYLSPLPKDLENYQIHHIKPLFTFNFNNKDGTINLDEVKKAFAPENHQLILIEEHRKINHFDLINPPKKQT